MTGFDTPTAERQHLTPLDELAARALAAWGLDATSPPVLINLSENATYRIDAGGRRYAMRVHRDGYHSRAGIASELAWLTALRTDGVASTPRPVPGGDGDTIQTVAHPALARPRHVVLFEWEDGSEPSEADDTVAMFAKLGETAARMHDHAGSWHRPSYFERHTWNFRTSLGAAPHWGPWRNGVGLDRPTTDLFARTVATIGERLARFGETPDRFGLIHADMRLANLLIDGDKVKVLDFDDCGFGWHLYDAAAAVSFFEEAPEVPELMAAWAGGYRTVRDLSANEEAEVPTFVLMRRLILIAWIGSHADTGLARSMGAAYTTSAADLCDSYLARFG